MKFSRGKDLTAESGLGQVFGTIRAEQRSARGPFHACFPRPQRADVDYVYNEYVDDVDEYDPWKKSPKVGQRVNKYWRSSPMLALALFIISP